MDFDLSKNGEEVTNISEKGLQRMSNLQFIRFDGRSCARHSSNLTVVRSSDNNCAHPDTVNALQDLNYQFQEIRLLHWINFRRLCLPSTFNPEFLVELNMPSSTCHTLWEGSKVSNFQYSIFHIYIFETNVQHFSSKSKIWFLVLYVNFFYSDYRVMAWKCVICVFMTICIMMFLYAVFIYL